MARTFSPRGGCSTPAAIRPPLGHLRDSDRDLAPLVRSAAAGDDAAWNRLVTRFDKLIRGVARRYRLQPSDVDDVVQTTWMQLLRDIHNLREPAALPAWLTKVSSRQCLNILGSVVGRQLTDDPHLGDQATHADVEFTVLETERRTVVADALEALPERHRKLMLLLASQPDPDYETISQTLAMPIGSIGPIRRRSIERLQRHPSIRAYRAAG